MAEAALKINLSPSQLTYEAEGKQKLILDSADRLNLQRYLLEGMTLPINNQALKAAFFLTDGMLADFQDLLKAFQSIQGHCSVFYNGAYTKSISLASSIIEFNTSAKYYLGGISKIADDYNHGRVTVEYAEESVTALINILLKQFAGFIKDCDEVCAGINRFLTETYQDNVTMNGQDGKSGLNKVYTDKYNLNDSEIKKLRDDLDEAKRQLDKASEDYNYNVTVAATTPTYAWIFPFGTIPAAVVAGVYGDRATAAYKKMGELRDKIAKSSADLNQKMGMTAGLSIASSQVQKLSELIKKAIAPIEQMKGTWIAMSDDLGALNKTVKEDITQLPMVVKNIGVDKALEQWDAIAKEAQDYRQRAFITETSKNLAQSNVISFPELKKA